MRALIVLLSLAAFSGEVSAREVVLNLTPAELRAHGWLQPNVVPGADELVVVSRAMAPVTMPVLDLQPPTIGTPTYAIVGEVSHSKLARPGYLEMWSHIPSKGAYFTRTLGQGVMRPLVGETKWREFVVPFFNDASGPDPERLVLNVMFGGPGEVRLRSMRLVRYAPGESPLRGSGQWWDERSAGLIGGIAGSVIGLFGAIIGTLAGGARARGFVFTALRMLAVTGIAVLVAGIVAVTRAQPYAVYYPLLLIGGMSMLFGFWMPVSLRRRYEEAELRKMRAADVVG